MNDLALRYCPYCKKMVPFHKAPRRGICWIFLIISYLSPILIIFFPYIPLPYSITWIIFLPLLGVGIIFLWIYYLRKVRPDACNLCGTRTIVIEKKCEKCGTPLESPDKFCKECGNLLT
ncbi:MAG: hypothetical protein ACTSPN_10525 [Promethearchaeota archaeon]